MYRTDVTNVMNILVQYQGGRLRVYDLLLLQRASTLLRGA